VTLLVFLLGVTWVPATLLLLVQMIFAGSTAFILQNLFLLPAITLVCVLQVGVSALTILALSSMSKSRRFVAIMFTGLLFFTAAMYQTLRGITGSRAWAWLSPSDALATVADRIFRIQAAAAPPIWAALITVVVLVAASLWILERRVRAVEVVA
jgi:hypothetical protein